jgi:hypothetical protein
LSSSEKSTPEYTEEEPGGREAALWKAISSGDQAKTSLHCQSQRGAALKALLKSSQQPSVHPDNGTAKLSFKTCTEIE